MTQQLIKILKKKTKDNKEGRESFFFLTFFRLYSIIYLQENKKGEF